MVRKRWFTAFGIWLMMTAGVSAGPQLKALIIDGQNNHDWKATTPVLKTILQDSGLFTVEVATSPPQGADISRFKPEFAKYDVVVSNYNGDPWSQRTQQALIDYVRSGGGFVSVHAANNAFPEWEKYNKMIGLGGWGGRDEKSGPYVYFQGERFIFGRSPGRGGGHGRRHPFQIVVRNREHPITAGLPKKWMHAEDELYHRLRGPAENVTFLATAYSEPETGGTGAHEPMLFVITYGKGRVFHTTLGHSAQAMKSPDFVVTLQRGAEWAATGKVTQKIPQDFHKE
ncbi:ThuA domain-containing protein [Acidobacteria bacterium AH-259-G07]|nr:ThuA domain-containing protein [Acidobacteria bacterium AH-259-G07]